MKSSALTECPSNKAACPTNKLITDVLLYRLWGHILLSHSLLALANESDWELLLRVFINIPLTTQIDIQW
ncbi:protein of unknown function [Vibrio tapetis subsp. tapetis]|uniref:Uncharacterized protein n=1 Tax=Vibrio tapetis subsp. tapetis TaxID=1671868 RepID=A0A2N8ZD96_9VIBR|nr:protein of unknown function [Vibrio tapetis subsp. tapetis]